MQVKVKGEGKYFKLAECAMRRGVSVRAYEAAEEETANGGGGKKRASFPPKKGRKKRKEGVFRKKAHKFSFRLSLCSKNETFFSQKIRPFETKFLLLRLIKHNFSFIPPHRGVYIAQSRGTFPDPPAQTLFDLLNHRDFALSLPIGTAPKDALSPNRETFAHDCDTPLEERWNLPTFWEQYPLNRSSRQGKQQQKTPWTNHGVFYCLSSCA